MTPPQAIPGRHRQPPLYRRLYARWQQHRQHRAIEAARDDAYVVRIAPHGTIPPIARARAAVASLRAVTDAFGLPPAAVLPDVDVTGLEHLRKPVYEFPTDTWAAYVDGMEP